MPQAAASPKTKAIKATCDHCGKTIRVPMSYAGKKGKCPKCMGVVRIPGGDSHNGTQARRPQPRSSTAARRPRRKPERKSISCPSCHELISEGALKCRHCSHWLHEEPKSGMDTIQTIRLVFICLKLLLIGCYVLFGG